MSTRIHISGRGAISGFGARRQVLFERIAAGESALRPRVMVTAASTARTGGEPAQALRLHASSDAARTNTRASTASQVSALSPSPVPLTAALAFTAEVPLLSMGLAARTADLPFTLACLAAREALLEARIADPAGVGLVLASAKADLSGIAGADAGSGSGTGSGLGSPALLARRVASELGLGGVTAAVSCACASGLVALSLAARRIARGEAERLLVVGVDVVHDFVLAGFASLAALDRDGCRPFDARRRGMSLGDGAGAILLSAHAAESVGLAIAGFGGANDACHATGPDREGAGLALAARRALDRAGLRADDIDFVHLHGTGTIANDACEARGLAALFGGRTPPAFGTKAQTGHTLGAAGVLETLLAGEALLRGLVPRNVGLEQSDVDPRLDLVREPRRLPRAAHALKVSAGFGGIQAALVLQATRTPAGRTPAGETPAARGIDRA